MHYANACAQGWPVHDCSQTAPEQGAAVRLACSVRVVVEVSLARRAAAHARQDGRYVGSRSACFPHHPERQPLTFVALQCWPHCKAGNLREYRGACSDSMHVGCCCRLLCPMDWRTVAVAPPLIVCRNVVHERVKDGWQRLDRKYTP